MKPYVWVGEKECAGKASVYVGPLLLAYDPRFDAYETTLLPAPDLGARPAVVEAHDTGYAPPIVLYRFPAAGGKNVTLCDFASAGAAGNPYVSWLPCPSGKPVPFTRDNPLRLTR
jgi:hypothetical protein